MEMILYGIPVSALIVAIVELLKSTFGLPARWAAPVAVWLGVVFSVLAWAERGGSLLEAMVTGIMLGLGASGMYSGGKAIAGR